MPPEMKTARITRDQVATCRNNIGKIADYPPQPDRPMMIRRIEPLTPPEGEFTHRLVTQLAEDCEGVWTIDEKRIRFTAARLYQMYQMIADRLTSLLNAAAETGFVLNLDDLQIREVFRLKAEAAVKAALQEDGMTDVVGVVVKYVIRPDLNEIHFAATATARHRGDLFELSMGDPSMPADAEML